ncbi:hypothetical protein C2P28_02215 [Campylobacter jejuni]|nr:hypothetical protein [Campylobacter jejuni]EAK4684420.1 hypothetical protein [Campylobacter jejuni]
MKMKKIMGYRREDGKFGLRNKVIIINTAGIRGRGDKE